jgi:hypothetical protein
MFSPRTLTALLLALLSVPTVAQKADFKWDWGNQEMIGRNDASVGNTSKLTEPERAQLIDAIVQRLQKPMTEAGYDDDRIREIASTTRIRFVEFGTGKPLLFATSMGMEGGCDLMGNCPLWIFRRSSGGFASLLDAIAANYTLQSADGDLVLMHHISKKQSGLEVYRLDDGKLTQAGCYTANWPTPSDDPSQVSDPEIVPCKEGTAEPAPLTPEPKPEMPAATAGEPKPDAPDQKPESVPASPAEPQPKPDTPDAKPSVPDAPQPQAPDAPDQQQQPAPDAPPQPNAKQPAPDAPAPDSKSQLPDAQQPPSDANPNPPNQQQPAPDNQAQPQSKPDAPANPDTPSKPDAPDPNQVPPASPTPGNAASPPKPIATSQRLVARKLIAVC